MSSSKKILKITYTIVFIIQLLIMVLLYLQNPIPEYLKECMPLLSKVLLTIGFLFLICIIIYLLENKLNNKNEVGLEDYNIRPSFDIDFRNKDIIYLSALFYKQPLSKKSLLLLIMQLINKNAINLSCYLNDSKYQYIIEKGNLHYINLSKVEQDLLNYLFKNSNRVNLIKKIEELYNSEEASDIVKNCNEYVKNFVEIKKSSMKKIYQFLTFFIAALSIFLGCMVLILASPLIFSKPSYIVVFECILFSFLSIFAGFIMTIILKKINIKYKYDNSSYLWICRNLIFLNSMLLASFIVKEYFYIQFIILIIYIFTTLTIMIMYNEHICLTKQDIETRKRLLSLEKYFKEMSYLKDKEFGNIITYEECLMYGFLFNITIKINDEFDILQKQLFDITKSETNLFIKLFRSTILK